MKLFKRITFFLGIIILIIGLSIGIKWGNIYYKSYKNDKELASTVLNSDFQPSDYEKSKKLKNGEILSKKLIDLSGIPPIWNKISKNDSLIDRYKHLNKINFYVIVYKSDSLLVNGIIAEPKKEGKHPVIVFNRGSNKQIGTISKYKSLMSLVFGYSELIREGYIGIASCYRENDEFGGDDINDVLNIVKTAKSLANADSNRVGMVGWSRGGMMTYLSLKHKNLVKTAVIGNGVVDLEASIIDRPEFEPGVYAKLIPNYKNNKKEELKKRSVIYWADKLDRNASLLIICSTEDKRVNPNQADMIADKLTEINYEFTLKKVKTDHLFTGKRKELNKLLINWFKEKL